MLALGYLHEIFPWTVRSHLAKCELLHAKKLNGNNCVISIREPNHILIYPALITDGIYVTFNYVLLTLKKVTPVLFTHQVSRVQWRPIFGNAIWMYLTVRYCRNKEQNIPLPIRNREMCYVSVGIVVTTDFKLCMYRVHESFLRTGSWNSSCTENCGWTELSAQIVI